VGITLRGALGTFTLAKGFSSMMPSPASQDQKALTERT
jgi:hypothetical protein